MINNTSIIDYTDRFLRNLRVLSEINGIPITATCEKIRLDYTYYYGMRKTDDDRQKINNFTIFNLVAASNLLHVTLDTLLKVDIDVSLMNSGKNSVDYRIFSLMEHVKSLTFINAIMWHRESNEHFIGRYGDIIYAFYINHGVSDTNKKTLDYRITVYDPYEKDETKQRYTYVLHTNSNPFLIRLFLYFMTVLKVKSNSIQEMAGYV